VSQKFLQILGVLILMALAIWCAHALLAPFVPAIVVTVAVVVVVAVGVLFIGRLLGLWT